MKLKIHFQDVGRRSMSWTAICNDKDFSANWFDKQIYSNANVMSSALTYGYKGNEGIIFAGFHTIGKFTIEKVKKDDIRNQS